MFGLTFLRAFRRGVLNLRRSRGILTTVTALFGVVILAQIFLTFGLGAQGIQGVLAVQNDFRLQLRSGVADRDTQEFLIAVRQLPSVTSVVLVTREKAMALEKAAHPEIATLLDGDALNPFRDSAVVTLGSLSAYDEFAAFVRHPRWNQTLDPVAFATMETRYGELQTTLGRMEIVRTTAFLLLIVSGIALLLTVLALVRKSATGRRQDLFVEQMSGADASSIVVPFAVEAVLQLFVALLLSIGVIALVLLLASPDFPMVGEARMFAIEYGPAVVAGEMFAVIAMGMVGAWFGTRAGQYAV